MAKGSFKCTRCDRKFSMAAHLARHVNSMHGAKRRTPAAKAKARRGPAKLRARRVGRPAAARVVGLGGSADLVTRMRTYHGTLVDRRDSLDAEISAITTAIEAMGVTAPRSRRAARSRGRVAVARKPRGRVGRVARAGSLKQFIVKAMGQRSTPMSPKEIAVAVVRTGYRSKAKDLTKAVSNTLPQLKKIKKVGFGKYRL